MAVRDSAGVRIVEYAREPTAARTIRLSEEPLYRHGHRDGDHLFARVSAGALLPDGSAVVADAISGPGGAQTVLRIGADGSLRAVLARPGQGPTEVRQVLSLHSIPPDTVLVEDDGNAKLMYFADTTFVRSVSTAAVDAGLVRGLRVRDVDEDGALLMTTSSFRMGFTVPWLPGQLVRMDSGTMLPDTVGSYDMVAFRPAGETFNPFSPFGDVTASGGQFVHARTDVPSLIWRGPDGSVRQILRWAAEPVYATDGDRQLFLESLRADLRRVNPDMSESRLEEFVAEQIANVRFDPAQPRPLFRDLRGDGAGGVWMSEFVPVLGMISLPRYTVVDREGAWLGTVEMPAGFRLIDVAYGRALGVLTDELGVESVAVYEVREASDG
jgi:hypothetical protein